MIGFHKGQVMPKEISFQQGADMQWVNYGVGGLTYYVGFNGMSQKEIDSLQRGAFQLGCFVKDEIIYFSASFYDEHGNEAIIPYSDSPFHPSLITDENFEGDNEFLESLKNDSSIGLAFNIVGFDTSTGIVNVIRSVGLENKFSIALAEQIESTYQNEIDKNEFFRRVLPMQNTYNSEQIYNMAQFRITHGFNR